MVTPILSLLNIIYKVTEKNIIYKVTGKMVINLDLQVSRGPEWKTFRGWVVAVTGI